MSWRPGNWENPHKCEKIMGFYPEQWETAARSAYEAGADAIVKRIEEQLGTTLEELLEELDGIGRSLAIVTDRELDTKNFPLKQVVWQAKGGQ